MRIIRYLLGEISRTNQLTAISHRLQQPFVIPRSCLCSQIESKVSTNAETQSQPQQTDDEVDSLYSRLVVETRGHDAAVLKSYEWFALEAAKRLEIPIHNTSVPRPNFYRRNALKSIHIYKKHMVQYEFRTYFRVIELKYLTGSTADTYLEYIQRNLPEGVAMKVTKTALERLPAHIKPPVKQFSTVK